MLLLDIPRTLGCHESAPVIPEINDQALIQCRIEAQERVTANVDLFQDWLGAQCIGQPSVQFGYIPRSDLSRSQFIESLTVAQLAAALLYPDRDLAGRAASELRTRYIKEKDDYIERIACELMDAGWAA